jgi:hypothetical protein
MKRMIVLLLVLIAIQADAQYLEDCFKYKKPFKQSKIPESVKVITMFAGSIILDAVGDGLNDDGVKTWGHVCNAASTGVLLATPFVIDYERSKWGYYLASYTFLRIALFDPSYNLTRDLPVTYIGNTSFWDKGLQKMAPPDGFLMGRGFSLMVGIAMPIKEFDVKRRRFR